MKTTSAIFMIGIISTMALITSCKKDKKTTALPPTLSRTQYLTKAPWKIIEAREKLNSNPWFDILSTIQPCELDNVITFLPNFTYIEDEGATKCDVTDPQTTTLNWAFNADETQYILKDGGTVYFGFPIVMLDADRLKTTYTIVVNMDTSVYEATYSH